MLQTLVGGAGFEPAKAMPSDLQSDPVGRLGIRPIERVYATSRIAFLRATCST